MKFEGNLWIMNSRILPDELSTGDNDIEISLIIRKGALYVEKKFSTFEELTSYALAAEEAFDY